MLLFFGWRCGYDWFWKLCVIVGWREVYIEWDRGGVVDCYFYDVI